MRFLLVLAFAFSPLFAQAQQPKRACGNEDMIGAALSIVLIDAHMSLFESNVKDMALIALLGDRGLMAKNLALSISILGESLKTCATTLEPIDVPNCKVDSVADALNGLTVLCNKIQRSRDQYIGLLGKLSQPKQ